MEEILGAGGGAWRITQYLFQEEVSESWSFKLNP